jgi:selenocysteine lyase/cysteine desulfurase
VEAAARFLLEEGMEGIAAAELALFAPLLTGLQSIPGVRVWGVQGLQGRTPTAAFTVAGHSTEAVAKAMAAERIAVWDGHAYAVEVAGHLGLADTGGVVRAGVSRYLEPDDVQRLLHVVERLAAH